MELTIDFDGPDAAKHRKGNIEHFPEALRFLKARFGVDKILVRKSSSGDGYHIRVLCDIDADTEMSLRAFLNDCRGRVHSDEIRKDAGMKTSRLFDCKGEYDERTGQTSARTVRAWRSAKDVRAA